MTGSTVGRISDAFRDEGFAPRSDIAYSDSSVRRTEAEQYLAAVNWSDRAAVARALRAWERLLWDVRPDAGTTYRDWDLFKRALHRDGYFLDDECQIVSRFPSLDVGDLSSLSDPSAILEQLDRLETALPADPALAIGTAKEVIESTAKVVLRERQIPFGDRDDIQSLIRRAQECLALHPSSGGSGPDASEPVRKILGALSALALGVAELRNRGYGTGHGPASARRGLRPRHANLAVNAAGTWCRLMLETLADEAAPWRPVAR